MASVIIALGSNLGEPHKELLAAKNFLQDISTQPALYSSIFRSEPLGPSKNDFLNAVIRIQTELSPAELFEKCKYHEINRGRPSRYPKWTARIIDLDIISYDDLVIQQDTLIIPHKEYTRRLFVLLPLQEIAPDWEDPKTGTPIKKLIDRAPSIKIKRTSLTW